MTQTFLELTAQALWNIQQQIKSCSLSPDEKKKALGFMSWIIRTATDLLKPKKSKAAQALFQNEDLSNYLWKDQHKIDSGRQLIVLDHKYPVSQMRDACYNANSLNEIKTILSQAEVVWITRDEDAKLNANGNRSNRQNPNQAYKNAGITIV